jgi:hypothetical protein
MRSGATRGVLSGRRRLSNDFAVRPRSQHLGDADCAAELTPDGGTRSKWTCRGGTLVRLMHFWARRPESSRPSKPLLRLWQVPLNPGRPARKERRCRVRPRMPGGSDGGLDRLHGVSPPPGRVRVKCPPFLGRGGVTSASQRGEAQLPKGEPPVACRGRCTFCAAGEVAYATRCRYCVLYAAGIDCLERWNGCGNTGWSKEYIGGNLQTTSDWQPSPARTSNIHSTVQMGQAPLICAVCWMYLKMSSGTILFVV